MNIYTKSSKQKEKVLLGGVAAAALGLINAKPKIVKATTLSNNKVTRNHQKKQFETKINYKTARNSTKVNRVSVKQTESPLRSSESDKNNLSDQAQDVDSKVDTNSEQTVDSVSNSQHKNNLGSETSRNTNSNTSTNTYQNNNRKNIKPRSNTENSSVIETDWCTVPITINTDTGVLTIKGGEAIFTYSPQIPMDIDDGIAAILEGTATINHSFDADIVNKITKINIVDTVIINGDGKYMFRNLPNLTEITGLENLDTLTHQTVTSLKDLFENDKSLVTIKGFEKNPKTKFDTSKLKDLTEMFKGCSSLTTLDLSGIDMSKVNNWTNMFADCSNLTTLTLGDKSKFDKTAGLTVAGTWINIESGQNNTGTKGWSSDELMSDYNGSEDSGTYTRYTGGKITVHYQDQDGKDILGLNETVQYGNVDDKLIDSTSTNSFQFKEKLNDINGKAYSFREAKIKDKTVDLKDVQFTAGPQDVTLIYAPAEAKPVTVYYKYKDEAGNLHDILDENGKPKTTTISGYLGDKSSVIFDDLANYKKDSYQINEDPVTESTDNPTIPLSEQEQTVTLIYDRIPAGKVAVYYKYKDEAGNLHDILDENGKPKTKTVSGYLGDKSSVSFDDLANYKKDSYQINDDPATESTDNPAVTLSEQEQTVTLIYDRIPAGKVTVYYKYKDEAGNLHDILDENGKPKTKTVSGYLGDKSSVSFDDLANYKKDSYQINDDPATESTDNPAVTLSEQEQTVTLIYDRIPAGKVTVYYKYKDEAGNLQDIPDENGKPKTTTVSGYLGDKSAVSFDDHANYKKDSYQINEDPVTESTDNPTIPLSEQEQKVTLIYTEKKTNNGSESNGSESNGSGSNESESNGSGSNGSGSNGSESNGSGSNGSESNGSGSNGSGSNGSGSNGSESNGSGSNGSESNGSGSNGSGSNGSGSNGSGSNGSGSNGSGSNGSGSNDSNASNTTGSIVNSPAAIAPAVTVHYQDEYGNTIAPDRVIQGRIGDGYTTGAETVSGYTLKTRPDNATGFFISSPQSVTYVYSKNDGQTNNSTTAPAGNQTPTDNEPTPIPTSKKAKKKKAPKKASKGLHANKQSKKAPAKSIKGLTANKHQANRPAKLAAAARKSTSVNDPQKGKLDKGSSTDALPQTGSEKHKSLAMLALGGLALATALGAAWLERKKD